MDTLRGEAPAVVRHLAALIAAEGAAIQIASPEEGYVETDWLDVRQAADAGPVTFGPLVRFRFWVDPVGGGRVRLVGEAAARRTVDPSLPPRQREVMVPREHPGYRILQRVMDAARARFGR